MQGASQGYRLLGLAVLSVLLMFADQRFDYLTQVRYYAALVVTPIQWLADLPKHLQEQVDQTLQSRNALLDENTRLRDELARQQYQLQKLNHLEAENRRLNELLNASSIVEERVMRAQLIQESPDPFSKRVLINKGGRDGVFLGQPVLDAFGLMGQVVEVEPFNSWVMLITDAQHATPVQVSRNGIRAIASGRFGTLHELELRNLPNTADITVGDLLVTSGLGQRFPAGYPVATIVSVVHDPGQPFAVVTASPAAQLDRSRNLLLVFAEQGEQDRSFSR
ncbi:MAG: rod shape-determining protein MreC [Pseudomonadales bacterium]|nr:rod shape-determining protein MreC [Pseudomonadales bacterium]